MKRLDLGKAHDTKSVQYWSLLRFVLLLPIILGLQQFRVKLGDSHRVLALWTGINASVVRHVKHDPEDIDHHWRPGDPSRNCLELRFASLAREHANCFFDDIAKTTFETHDDIIPILLGMRAVFRDLRACAHTALKDALEPLFYTNVYSAELHFVLHKRWKEVTLLLQRAADQWKQDVSGAHAAGELLGLFLSHIQLPRRMPGSIMTVAQQENRLPLEDLHHPLGPGDRSDDFEERDGKLVRKPPERRPDRSVDSHALRRARALIELRQLVKEEMPQLHPDRRRARYMEERNTFHDFVSRWKEGRVVLDKDVDMYHVMQFRYHRYFESVDDLDFHKMQYEHIGGDLGVDF